MHAHKFAENGVFLSHTARESRTAIWGGGCNGKGKSCSLLEYVIIHNTTCNIMSFNVCTILIAINCSYTYFFMNLGL